jgi:hypothetical protein
VTTYYPHLRGLRLVPLGLPFLISAFWRIGQISGVPLVNGLPAERWFVGMLAVALGAAYAVGTYYERHYGRVQPQRAITHAIVAFALGMAFVLTVWSQDTFRWAVSLPILLVACALAIVGSTGGQVRAHYFVLAGACAMFSFLGTLGVPFVIRDVLLDILVGGGFILIGVGDHIVLRRTLSPVSHAHAL